eukprot:scaffold25000_cov50-Phaeocystis_antarctica.AAC.1
MCLVSRHPGTRANSRPRDFYSDKVGSKSVSHRSAEVRRGGRARAPGRARGETIVQRTATGIR